MARIKIAEIPKKYVSFWDDKALCVVDTWEDFHAVTIEDVERTLVAIVIPFIVRKNCNIHIIDNSRANGAFSREVTEFFRTEIAALMRTTKVHYFVTVVSEQSPIANLSMRTLTDEVTKEEYYWIDATSITDGLNKIEGLKAQHQAC